MSETIDPGDARFWELADRLVGEHPIVIDRPRGSRHPRHPGVIYPLDYGYLDGTTASDGGGIDCWRGSQAGAVVTGAIVTVDVFKEDCEIKWLIGCTGDETALALATHKRHRIPHSTGLLDAPCNPADAWPLPTERDHLASGQHAEGPRHWGPRQDHERWRISRRVEHVNAE